MRRGKKGDWEKRALAWLLTVGVTFTSVPQNAIWASEFGSAQDIASDALAVESTPDVPGEVTGNTERTPDIPEEITENTEGTLDISGGVTENTEGTADISGEATENTEETADIPEDTQIDTTQTDTQNTPETSGENQPDSGDVIILPEEEPVADDGAGNIDFSGEPDVQNPGAEVPDAASSQAVSFRIAWSDGHDAADRRPDKMEEVIRIYGNEELIDSAAYSIIETKVPDRIWEKADIFEYTVNGLPVCSEDTADPIVYTAELDAELLKGYETMTADALSASDVILQDDMAAPGERLSLETEENDSGSKKYFGNYLPAYAVSGTVEWKDSENQAGVRPDMDAWFANQFAVTRNQQVYPAARVFYSAEESDPDIWLFTVENLFTTDESGAPASYHISAGEAEGYTTDGGADVGGNTDPITLTCTINEESAETPEGEPTEAPTETPEGEPTKAPTETPEGEPTKAPAEIPEGEPTEVPAETPEGEPTVTPEGEPTETPKPKKKKVLTEVLNAAVTVNTGDLAEDSLSTDQKIAIENSIGSYTVDGVTYESFEDLQNDYPDAVINWSWSEKAEGGCAQTVTVALMIPVEEGADSPVCTVELNLAALAGQYSVTGMDVQGDYYTLGNTGSVTFTRVGTTAFSAAKSWKDNNEHTRPETKWYLYRKIAGGSEEAVPGSDGKQVSWKLKTSTVHEKFNNVNRSETVSTSPEISGEETLPIGGSIDLPAYDPLGNRYIYYAKEVMSGSDKLYHAYSDDGIFTDGAGAVQEENVSVSNGGILTNRLEDTIESVSENINWVADQYKGELGDVTVIMTLQSRPAEVDSNGSHQPWTDVTEGDSGIYTREVEGFSSGSLSKKVTSGPLPAYNSEGKKLEYRWIQTGVKQGGTDITITSTNNPDDPDEKTFKLSQNAASTDGEEYFRSYIVPEGAPYAGTIVNKLEGNTFFHVTKLWGPLITEEEKGTEVTISLDQKDASDRVINHWDNLKIRMEANSNQWELLIDAVPDKEGELTGSPLPKYDDNGARYQYEIVETESETWYASYEKTDATSVTVTNKKRTAADSYKVLESNGSASARLVWRDISERDHTTEHLPVQLRYKIGDGRWGIVECKYENGKWVPNFTDEQKKILGITEDSNLVITENGENKLNRTLSISGLPSKIQYEKDQQADIQWDVRLDVKDNQTYTGIDATETTNAVNYIVEQKFPGGSTSVQNGNRIYNLTPTMDFSIDVNIRNGYDDVLEDVTSYLEWFTILNVNGKMYQRVSDIKRDYPTASVEWVWDENSKTAKLRITGLPWCDEAKDDTGIYVTYNRDAAHPVVGNYEESYNNHETSNFGSCTDHAHNGGTLTLTRTGTVDFVAHKEWLDDNTTQRPETTWTLWRYTNRDGEGFQTAAPVRGKSGNIVTWTLNTSKVTPGQNTANSSEKVSVNSDPSKGNTTEPNNGYENLYDLPKYDSDGFEYIYFVIEEMAGGTDYVQNFGQWKSEKNDIVENDTLRPVDISKRNDPNHKGDRITREQAGNALFNGGYTTNRPEKTVSASQTKTWEAANYQTDISDVVVELTLQSCREDDPNENWTAIQKDGAPYTQMLTDFKTETITKTVTAAALPGYDEMGHALKYRWVETGVYENAKSKENLLKSGKFQLGVNENSVDGPEHFESKVQEVDGKKMIVNRLVGTTDYYVEKEWSEGTKPQEITVTLEQWDSADNLVQRWENVVVPYKEGEKQCITITNVPDGEGGFTDQLLPKFDENGSKYKYIVVETSYDEWVGVHDYNLKNPDSEVENLKYGYNNVKISNGPGTISKQIRVRKQWLDDGDTPQRKPVTLEVGRVKENETPVKLTEVTLTEDQKWWSWVTVTEFRYERNGKEIISKAIPDDWQKDTKADKTTYATEDEWREAHFFDAEKEGWKYYIKEINVDGKQVNYKDPAKFSQGGYPTVATGEDGFRYEVMYPVPAITETVSGTGDAGTAVAVAGGIDSEGYYTVQNRRIGYVNVTVTKTWIDAGQTKEGRGELGAKLVLNCVEYPDAVKETSKGKGTVEFPKVKDAEDQKGDFAAYSYPILDNEKQPVGREQVIGKNLDSNNKEIVYFWNLPKYDAAGRMVHYQVQETDKNEALAGNDYKISIQESYQVVPQVSHSLDKQDVTVTNKREKIRDVHFHKRWIDQSVFEAGSRPDIYLVLYRAKRGEDGTIGVPEEMDYQPRKWDKEKSDSNYYWTCTFENLPGYSEDGEEYIYYAQEEVQADAKVLDYIDVQYAKDLGDVDNKHNDPNYRGPELELLTTTNYTEGRGYVVTYAEDEEGFVKLAHNKNMDRDIFVLKEKGVFVNQIRKKIQIQGKKVWQNIPVGFPAGELPKLNFDLMRHLKGKAPTEAVRVAEIANVTSSDYSFEFIFKYEGKNETDGSYSGPLPATDPGIFQAARASWQEEEMFTAGTGGSEGQPDPDRDLNDGFLLPKYDLSTGALYSYYVRETTEKGADLNTAYEAIGKYGDNNYMIINTFRLGIENQSSVTVTKKWSDVTEKFPETEFTLYRFYELVNKNEYSAVEKVATKRLSSNSTTKSVTFENLLALTPNKTPYIYFVKETSVNGYETLVSVDMGVQKVVNDGKTGWPSELGGGTDNKPKAGYSDAFQLVQPSQKGTVKTGSESEEKPLVPVVNGEVTYTNDYQHPEIDTVSLQGKKIWNDYGDAFNTRPDLTLKVYRWAENQATIDGGNNAIDPVYIGSVTVPYNVTAEAGQSSKIIEFVDTKESKDKNIGPYKQDTSGEHEKVVCTISEITDKSNSWTYTFTNLDRYAPNGNPWIYQVVETVDATQTGSVLEPYKEKQGGIAKQTNSDRDLTDTNKVLTVRDLENELKKITLTAKKSWNLLINHERPDVTFELQVKEGESGVWKWAKDYFIGDKALTVTGADGTLKAYSFKRVLTPKSGSNEILEKYENLPIGVGKGTDYKKLFYRVREIKIGDVDVSFDDNSVDYAANQDDLHYTIDDGIGEPTSDSNGNQSFTITNTPKDGLTSLTVTKAWDDKNNAFESRGATWKVWFRIFRTLGAGGAEEEVLTVPDAHGNQSKYDFSINNNTQNHTWSTSQLPKFGYDASGNKIAYIYYVKEISGNQGVVIEDNNELLSNMAYTVNNGIPTPTPKEDAYEDVTQTVTNKMKTTSLKVTKKWEKDSVDFRPVDLKWNEDIFLYRSTVKSALENAAVPLQGTVTNVENVTKFVSGSNAPITSATWTKNDTTSTWTMTIAGLPQCDSKGQPYYYAVKEKTQDGYLIPVEKYTDTSSDTTPQEMFLTNIATQFRLNKTDTKGSKINEVTLTFKREDSTLTDGWKLIWSRNENGIESYEIIERKESRDTVKGAEVGNNANPQVTVTGLPLGRYTLTDEVVPEGFETAVGREKTIILSCERKDGKVYTTLQKIVGTGTPDGTTDITTDNTTGISTVSIIDYKQTLSLMKVDSATDDPIDGNNGITSALEEGTPQALNTNMSFAITGEFAVSTSVRKQGTRYLFSVPEGITGELLKQAELIATKNEDAPENESEIEKPKENAVIYTLKEVKAPKGYVPMTAELKFTMTEDGAVNPLNFGKPGTSYANIASVSGTNDNLIIIKNDPIAITLYKKTALENGTGIAGAQFKLEKWETSDDDSSGAYKLITEEDPSKPRIITSGQDGSVTLQAPDWDLECGGRYRLTEIKAGDGYILNDTPVYFKINGNGVIESDTSADTGTSSATPGSPASADTSFVDISGTVTNSITVKNDPIKVRLRKADLSGTELEGAEFEVKGIFAGTTASTITLSKNNGYVLDRKLIGGNVYTITETKAPGGYQKPETGDGKTHFTLTVGMDGKIKASKSEDVSSDGANGKLDLNGTTIEVLGKLTDAPDTIVVAIRDTAFMFTIMKVDKDAKGAGVPNITFTMKRTNGEKFPDDQEKLTLVSNSEDKVGPVGQLRCEKKDSGYYTNAEFMKLLYAGETYTLHEEELIASKYVPLTGDITFTIGLDGKLSVPEVNDTGYNSAVELDDDCVVMTIENRETQFSIEKKGNETGAYLAGAELEIYKKDDWDETNACPIAGKIAVMTFTTAEKKLEIKGLEAGDYVLYEKTAPDGYAAFKPIHFKLTPQNVVEILEVDKSRVGTAAGQDIQLTPPASTASSDAGYTLTITDTYIRGHVSLHKTLQGGSEQDPQNLQNAVFSLYCVKGTKHAVPGEAAGGDQADTLIAQNLTTGAEGIWTSVGSQISRVDKKTERLDAGLEEGKYYFVETAVPNNVKLDSVTKWDFEIGKNDHGKTVTVDAENEPFEASVTILKTEDAAHGYAPVSEAVFQLDYSSESPESNDDYRVIEEELKTDEDGMVKIEGLLKGYYRLREVSNLGYQSGSFFTGTFQITENDENVYLEYANGALQKKSAPIGNGKGIPNTRIPGSVTLKKVDKDNSQTELKGVTFKLQKKAVSGEHKGEYEDVENLTAVLTGKHYTVASDGTVTSKENDSNGAKLSDGTLIIDGLDWGDYRITETKALPGYVNNGQYFEFMIQRADRNIDLKSDKHDIYNEQNILVIGKIDKETKQKLTGAKFKVLDKDGKSLNPEVIAAVTGDTVTLKGKLTGGKDYILRETEAPEGYELAADISFRMAENGKVFINDIEVTGNLITVEDEAIEVTLIKRDEDTNAVLTSPAYFTLYEGTKETGTKLKDNIATSGNGSVLLNKASIGVLLKKDTLYTLEETTAPAGYELADDITFKLDENGKICELNDEAVSEDTRTDVLTVEDKKITASMEKQDLSRNVIDVTKYGAAEFQVTGIFADDENESTKNVTSVDMSALDGQLIAGNRYVMTETKAPEGYELTDPFWFIVKQNGELEMVNTVDAPQNPNVSVSQSDSTKLIIKDAPISVSLTKTALGGSTSIESVPGRGRAEFTVTGRFAGEKAPSAITEVTSANIGVKLDGRLVAGETYTFMETKAPAGYELAAPFAVTVANDGTVTLAESGTATENGTAAEDGTAAENGMAIESGTVTESGTVADASHAAASDEQITVQDTPIEILLEKIDADTKAAVAGAEFSVAPADTAKDKFALSTADKIIVTDSMPNTLSAELIAGNTYVITETKAPDGYELAEPVKFTVKADGTVEIVNEAGKTSPGTAVNGDTVQITIADRPTGARIVKVDADNHSRKLSGAKFTLTWENAEHAEESRILEIGEDGWLNIPKGVLVQGLSYTLTETKAPEGYQLPNPNPSVTFTVETDGTLTPAAGAGNSSAFSISDEAGTAVITVENTATKVAVIKKSNENNQETITGAKLQLTDSDDNVVKTWDTGSAAELIQELKVGENYTLTEIDTPDGYTTAAPICFTVDSENHVKGLTDADKAAIRDEDQDGVYTITMTDVVVRGHVRLHKILKGEQPQNLQDAVFSLYRVNGIADAIPGKAVDEDAADTLIAKNLTTDLDGIWTSVDSSISREDKTAEKLAAGLEKGSYYFVETAVPNHVELDGDTKWSFEIRTADHGNTVTVEAENEPFKVSVTLLKTEDQAHGYAPVSGAVFELDYSGTAPESDSDYTLIRQQLTTDTNGRIKIEGLHKGYYRLREVSNPGYQNDSFFTGTFRIEENDKEVYLEYSEGAIQKSTSASIGAGKGIPNTRIPGSVTLRKLDGETGEELKGVTFKLQRKDASGVYADVENLTEVLTGTYYTVDSDGNVTGDAADSDGKPVSDGTLIIDGLDWGEYRITETKTIPGYVNHGQQFDFGIQRESRDIWLKSDDHDIYNEQNILKIGKIDKNTKQKLTGAKFEILDKAGHSLEPKVTAEVTGDTVTLKGVLTGGEDYILRETEAPEGYELAGDIAFCMTEAGQVTVGGKAVADNQITVADEPIEIRVVKVDAADSTKFLPGAEFTLKDAAGKILAQKLTTGSDGALTIPRGLLIQGQIYTLAETKAPDGYLLPVDQRQTQVTFAVQTDGTLKLQTGYDTTKISGDGSDTITVKNIWTKLIIAKVSNETGEPVSGALLQILKNGKVVKEWTTDGLALSLEGLLPGRYTLHEEECPEGYLKAEDISFVLGEDNSIVPVNAGDAGKITESGGIYTVTMTDVYIRGQVEIHKTLGNKKPLAGAVFDLYKAASGDGAKDVLLASGLTTDENGFWSSASGKVIREDNGEPLGDDLEKGSYYFVETATAETACLDSTQKYSFEIAEKDHATSQIVQVDNPAFAAELILKKVDDTDLSPVSDVSFDVFYDKEADGSFGEMAGTITTGEDGIGTLVLAKKGFYKLVETAALGYDIAEPFTAYLEVINEDHGLSLDLTSESIRNRLIVEAGTISGQGIENTRLTGKVTLVKADAVTGERLNGVSFQLLKLEEADGFFAPVTDLRDVLTGNSYHVVENLDGTELAENGRLEISGLEWGSYVLVETQAAPGYVNSGAELRFTIDRFHRDETVYTDIVDGEKLVLNQKNFVEIHKVDEETGRLLVDAVFEVYEANDDGTADTTASVATVEASDGTARIEGVLTGGTTYVLREIKAPNGYKLAEDIIFTMMEDGTVTIADGELPDNRIIVEDEPLEDEIDLDFPSNYTHVPDLDITTWSEESSESEETTETDEKGKKPAIKKTPETEKADQVKTGDSTEILPYILLLFLAGGSLLGIVLRRRKRN